MVAKDEYDHNVLVPGLIIENEQGIRRFTRSMCPQGTGNEKTFQVQGFKI
jgi:hypothetical protein